MVLLLKISVENILHRINHFHHNNKSADDNIFAFEAEGTVNNIECLYVNIPDISTARYSGLKINVDSVYIDGNQLNYITSPNAINTAYAAIGQEPGTRIYLYDGWDNTGVADVPLNTSVTDNVRVVFTVTGTGVIPETTQPSETQPDGLLTQIPDNGFSSQNNTTTVEAAVTGDGGVAAVAVAGLAVTACAACLLYTSDAADE